MAQASHRGRVRMSRFAYLQEMLASLVERYTESTSRDDDRTLRELCEALLSNRGELSGNQLANSILLHVEAAGSDTADSDTEQNPQNKKENITSFFEFLLHEFDIEPEAAVSAAQAYAEDASLKNWRRLRSTTEARRQELLRRLNRAPGATGKLVALRAHLLSLLPSNPHLARVDSDFEHLFNAWFNRGFLLLRQIDWNTPASVLEKIIQYEAVHAINDWADLRSRLEPEDRRCFAFFHPAMPDDPLIFVEVALTKSLPDSIQTILQPGRSPQPVSEMDTAVFYSISNCQIGLKGVSFGNFLIKQVANELQRDFPNLKTFRTLSPVPSLMRWVNKLAATDELYEAAAFARSVSTGDHGELEDAQRRLLSALAAHYLVNVRRSDEQPKDPVARFHLGNGASLSQVVAAADTSSKGLTQSASIMVSYLYDLSEVANNHESYATSRTVARGREVENLLASL